MSTEDHITGNLTKVSSISVGNLDVLWVVRHYTGLGSILKLTDTYVIRERQFLGRFQFQEKATLDAAWNAASEHKKPATSAEIDNFRKIRLLMLSLTDKVWA